MAKILETRLPLAGLEITPEIFNRLVRILELNLDFILNVETKGKLNIQILKLKLKLSSNINIIFKSMYSN